MMRRMRLALLIVAAMACALTASAHAAAGTYDVVACNAAAEGTNNSWTWSTNAPSSGYYSRYESCPYRVGGSGGSADQQSGLSTTDALGLSSGAAPGSGAGWTFTAPAGTTISGITYERDLGHASDPSNYWAPAMRADGTIVGETCQDTVADGETCAVGGPPGKGTEAHTISGLAAHELSVSIVCEAASEQECVTGATRHKVWAALYGATVTLSDEMPPTLSEPSGSLWGPGESGGYHTGTESVTVEAADVGGGVRSIILSSGGAPVTTYEAACDYTYPQPCPSSTGPQTLTLPTGSLGDGTHTLTLVAVDAAGNRSTVASEQIIVDNTPPGPPVDLTASATEAGGSTFSVTWSDPSGQVAPISSATYQLCPAGSGPCESPTSAPATGPVNVTVPGTGSWTLAVWLTDAAGHSSPANYAETTLTVPEPGGSGAGGSAGSGGSGSTGSGGGSGSEGGSLSKGGGETGSKSGAGHGSASGGSGRGKTKLRITARLRRSHLIVHVHDPGGRHVRVSFVAWRHGRRIAHARKRVRLRHGRKLVTFRLTRRVRRHGRIVVQVRLGPRHVVRRVLRAHGVRRRRLKPKPAMTL